MSKMAETLAVVAEGSVLALSTCLKKKKKIVKLPEQRYDFSVAEIMVFLYQTAVYNKMIPFTLI